MPWGIYRLLTPSSVAVSAGIVAHSATDTTELRAVYGGLQATLGILALIGVFADRLLPARTARHRPGRRRFQNARDHRTG